MLKFISGPCMHESVNMANKTLTVIVVVIVVIAAVAAAFVVLSNNDDDDTTEFNIDGLELLVLGNANNDLTIDSEDIEIIQSIIDGEVDDWESTYPLADANSDGEVNSEDLALVQALASREECTVYVLCEDTNGNEKVVGVEYPLQNITLVGVGVITAALYTNAGDSVVAWSSAPYSYDNMYQTLGGENIVSEMVYMDVDAFTRIDGQTPVGAVFIDKQYTWTISDSGYSAFDTAGIPYLVYATSSPEDHTSAMLTIGFLCGEETAAVGNQHAQSTLEVIEYIDNRLGDLSDEEKATFMTFAISATTICQNSHPNQQVGILAGGIPYYQTNSEFASQYEGSSAGTTAADALAEYRDADAYIFIASNDFGTDPTELVISIMEPTSGNNPLDFFYDAIENWYYINNLLPSAVKIAYAAEVMYPELFEGYGDQIAQQFIDEGYDPLVGQTLESLCAFLTYQDYVDAKAAQGTA